MRVSMVAGFVAAAVLGGCAKNSGEISAAYVSPYQYENWTCPQLADEAARVNSRAMSAAGIQDQKATRDAVVTTVGVVIFWPALFFVGGNDQQTAELAQLRGQAEAIEASARHKQCGMGAREAHGQTPPPEAAFAQAGSPKRVRSVSRERDGDGVAGLPYGLNSAD